jgi:DNA topoisomerase I
MQENLVIVESPAKAKKIEEFLGKDYKVMSSYGHIRDLKKKELSINEKTMEPDYEIPEEKKKTRYRIENECEESQENLVSIR